jgi:hypothetical protein
MYKRKFEMEIIPIQDSKKTKFKSQYCCKNLNLTPGRLATPSSRLHPDGSQISYMFYICFLYVLALCGSLQPLSPPAKLGKIGPKIGPKICPKIGPKIGLKFSLKICLEFTPN